MNDSYPRLSAALVTRKGFGHTIDFVFPRSGWYYGYWFFLIAILALIFGGALVLILVLVLLMMVHDGMTFVDAFGEFNETDASPFLMLAGVLFVAVMCVGIASRRRSKQSVIDEAFRGFCAGGCLADTRSTDIAVEGGAVTYSMVLYSRSDVAGEIVDGLVTRLKDARNAGGGSAEVRELAEWLDERLLSQVRVSASAIAARQIDSSFPDGVWFALAPAHYNSAGEVSVRPGPVGIRPVVVVPGAAGVGVAVYRIKPTVPIA